MEIQRLGGYLEVDERRYLKKRADASNIQDRWLDAVVAAKEAYLSRWGDALHSVYLRGSVVNGGAVEYVSDLDSFAVFREGGFDAENVEAWEREAAKDLEKRFPFVAGFELVGTSIEEATARENVDAFIVKVEAACVYGEDLARRIEGYRPGPEMAFQTRYFRNHLETFRRDYPRESERERPETLAWILRRFLRLGMELVMEEERRFTRDLYLCYESFVNHYPEKRKEMFHALELAVNPVATREAEDFTRNLGNWLAGEADKRLARWTPSRTS